MFKPWIFRLSYNYQMRLTNSVTIVEYVWQILLKLLNAFNEFCYNHSIHSLNIFWTNIECVFFTLLYLNYWMVFTIYCNCWISFSHFATIIEYVFSIWIIFWNSACVKLWHNYWMHLEHSETIIECVNKILLRL